MYISVICRSKR